MILLIGLILMSSLNPYELMEQNLAAFFALERQQGPRIARLELHPAQAQVRREAKRFNVLDCGRRWGKTKDLCDLLVETAEQGYPAGYFAPSYKYLLDGWRDLQAMCEGFIADKSEQEKRLELTTGGVIECWSLDNEGAGEGKKTYKAGRGRKYKRVVIDEAALVANLEGVFDYAISPTLIDLLGDAWFGSTPNGKGGFYRLFLKGQVGSAWYDPDWKSWRMPTSSNPYIPPSEIERERRTKPDHVFRQEYLAEFLEDSGQVFRNITACTLPKAQVWQDKLVPYHVYLIAWDLAKKNDFSVMGVIDCTTKRLVKIDRFNRVEYMQQIPRLIALVEAFQPVEVVVEKNGNEALMEILRVVKYQKLGPPPRLTKTEGFDQDQVMQAEAVMRRMYYAQTGLQTHPATMPITEFEVTNASKEEAIQALVLAFERQEITIPDDPTLLSELEEFGMERLPSGRFRYEAPSGSHDDTVSMLCEGWYRARRYMSAEALPLRERAMRTLAPELRPENIEQNPNPMAVNSQQYWVNSYEKRVKDRGTHFLSRFGGLGR